MTRSVYSVCQYLAVALLLQCLVCMNAPIWYFADGSFSCGPYTLTATMRYGVDVGEIWELRYHGAWTANFRKLDDAMDAVRTMYLN